MRVVGVFVMVVTNPEWEAWVHPVHATHFAFEILTQEEQEKKIKKHEIHIIVTWHGAAVFGASLTLRTQSLRGSPGARDSWEFRP
jgi:hypothetical protein